MKHFLFLIVLTLSFSSNAQTIEGFLTSNDGKAIEGANISIVGKNIGTTSDEKGFYSLKTSANQSQEAIFSFIGYRSKKLKLPMLKMGQTYELDVTLNVIGVSIDNIDVEDQKNRTNTFEKVDVKNATSLPSTSGGVESLIKTLPGVSSSTELSSQYSVRGGNFDENLVYVNGIEIYRPFLIRSGQQEGLSFVNSDLVSSISFSAGGYAAQYGDKMSSVLDIK